MAANKTYLGDSVYCELVGGVLVLTTDNGQITGPSNRICLEGEAYAALVAWIENLKEDAKHL